MKKCSNTDASILANQRCSKCDSYEVVYCNKTAGKEENLCTMCFTRFIEEKFISCVDKYSLIADGDIIGVGVSGGKDSQFLLHLLQKYQLVKSFHIKCFMVDEGIKDYKEKGIGIIKEYTQENNLQLFTTTMKSEYGYDVDEFVGKYYEMYSKPFRVCSICDTIRINIVRKMAMCESCNKLALGINLDDHMVAFFDSMQSKGIDDKLCVVSAKNCLVVSDLLHISPISLITDKEIHIYNKVNKIPYQYEPPCPYADSCLDERYREIICDLEELVPEYRMNAWNSIQTLNMRLAVNTQSWNKCIICGVSHKNESDICLDCERYSELRTMTGI